MPTRKMSYCGGAYKDVGQQDRGCGGGGGCCLLSADSTSGGGGGGGRGVAMASAATPTLGTPMNM